MYKKISIFIGILLLILAVVIYITFRSTNEESNTSNHNITSSSSSSNKSSSSTTKTTKSGKLIIDNMYLKYNNNKYKKLDTDDFIEEDYKIYIDSSYFGSYNVHYIKTWNLFNTDGEYVHYDGEVFAYNGNISVSLRDLEEREINDTEKSEVKNIGYNLDLYDLYVNQVITTDIDNNGVIDKIVNVSNVLSRDQSKYFNLVYVVLNNKRYILIDDEIEVGNVLITPIYDIHYVASIDSKDNIIIRNLYYSMAGEKSYSIFEFNENKFTKVFG